MLDQLDEWFLAIAQNGPWVIISGLLLYVAVLVVTRVRMSHIWKGEVSEDESMYFIVLRPRVNGILIPLGVFMLLSHEYNMTRDATIYSMTLMAYLGFALVRAVMSTVYLSR